MAFFAKLKVAARLAWGFGITCAIGIAIGLLGLFEMNRMSHQLDDISSGFMVKMSLCADLTNNFNQIARAARNYMLFAGDSANREAELVRIRETRARNTELLAKLDKLVVFPQGRKLLETVAQVRPTYNATIDRALDLSRQGQQQEAVALLTGDLRSQQAVLFKAVDDLSGFQEELGRRVAEDAKRDASRVVLILSFLALLMLIAGISIAWLVTRSLRRALGAEPGEVSEAVGRVADGDLATPVAVRAGDKVSTMAAVQRMQRSLAEIVGSVRHNAESVATASAQIAQGNQDLSQRTEEQASSLQETAATMDELSSTVNNNAQSSLQANQMARSASDAAAKGGEVVGQVVRTMSGINDSSRKIADIIGTIDSIAFQTNILALNAAVEAARAGEQGRGFAVVAGEVRSLAQRSASAAKEIKDLITGSVEQVAQGSALVNSAGQTMQEIIGAITRVSDIVAEISAASSEQSQGIAQVGQAVQQMDQVTQQNAALVEESAAAASSLQGQAQRLVELVAVFRVQSQGAASFAALPAPA